MVNKKQADIRKMKDQLKEEHEYFSKQFNLMSNLLQDMHNKSEYFFNKYS